MKRIYLLILSVIISMTAFSQSVFFDDFESGTSKWVFTGKWALDAAFQQSGSFSLTEDPAWYAPAQGGTGGYQPNVLTYATMATGVDLSTALDANLTFWTKYHLEPTFDFMYVQISVNGGTWSLLKSYDDANISWFQDTISLGGYVGGSSTSVKIRFKFDSDGAYEEDGMWIDDIDISVSSADNASPLIVHTPPEFYEGVLTDFTVLADIIDISGVASTEVNYSVDNGEYQTLTPDTIAGNSYEFTIPMQSAGSWVSYYIKATDSTLDGNADSTEIYEYISGNHIIQDNGVVDFIYPVGPAASSGITGVAVKVTLGSTDVVAALIRNYTDISNPNDSLEFHIWDDIGGLPGADMITPIVLFPVATILNTSAFLRIDLRPLISQLSGLAGDYYSGYEVPGGECNTVITQPGLFGVSYEYDGNGWALNTTDDFHFRVVTTANEDVIGPNILNNTFPIDYEGTLSDMNVNATILDASGIASAVLVYSVDGGVADTIVGINTTGDIYDFLIPLQAPGALVVYNIIAVDASVDSLITSSADFEYISGNYIAQDATGSNAYGIIGGLTNIPAIAQEFTINGTADLVSALIENYFVDSAITPIFDMLCHVYTDTASGGVDLISPVVVTPVANASENSAWAVVDLRSFSTELSGLSGKFFVSFSAANDSVTYLQTTIGTFGTSYYNNGLAFVPDAADYHIRIVTSSIITGTNEVNVNDQVTVFPNPATDNFTIVMNPAESGNEITVEVYNMLGHIVYSDVETAVPGVFTKNVDMSSQSRGMYFLRIIIGENSYQQKIIVR